MLIGNLWLFRCAHFREQYASLGLQPGIRCWLTDFMTWLRDNDVSLQLQSGQRDLYPWDMRQLEAWLATTGSDSNKDMGFERYHGQSRLAWFRLVVYSASLPRYTAGFQALPAFRSMERMVQDMNSQSGSSIGGVPPQCLRAAPVFQTSELWPRVFTEVTAVNGTIYAIVIIAILATWSILIFTASLRAAGAVMVTVLAILVTILGVFHLMGWTLGIVEAISISILLGSSVDYSLHIAESYIELTSKLDDVLDRRQTRLVVAQAALADVGRAVFNAAVTTALSVSALMFCEVVIFQRFGLIILISVVVSVTASVTLLPALLATFGPTDNHAPQASRSMPAMLKAAAVRCALGLAATLLVVALLVLTLYAVDSMCGTGCRCVLATVLTAFVFFGPDCVGLIRQTFGLRLGAAAGCLGLVAPHYLATEARCVGARAQQPGQLRFPWATSHVPFTLGV